MCATPHCYSANTEEVTKDDLWKMALQAKDQSLQAKDESLQAKDQSLQITLHKSNEALQKSNEAIAAITRHLDSVQCQLEEAKLKLAHFEHKLTMRFIIETFESRFSTYPKRKGRQEQWSSFLSGNDSIYQPFREEGLTIEEVSSEVASIYRSRSMEVHLITTLGTSQFAIHAKENLTEKQLKIIQCLVKAAGWNFSVV
ncbi:hypothetical protein BC829DRAFT_422463 [Chytridium lagenaria]|nr:hypothetical protein BC829DRAFT_422463 [Chytridium lagenaria]